MASNSTKEIMDLLTTLGFVLLMVLPFLRRKKKTTSTPGQDGNPPVPDAGNTPPKPSPAERLEAKPVHQSTLTSGPGLQRRSKPASPLVVEEVVIMEPSEVSSTRPARTWPGMRKPRALRRAVIMKEILDKPKGW